ncbi:adenosine deaminase [Tenggerimyces flavus]|uniref:adenosine deaminase n=1 Tax=Tenggerimyces flavus TaxID=1708749 RepID=A0ABV7YGF0_9ACTN|nr:adenosine deaminase [Tenggerimyces flavus]MBM7786756.1 adenosine deaminase [Tenggerimyces flavus]
MDLETLRRLPKIALHDHLDGGLRPATIVELAAEAGYGGLPTTDTEALHRWFVEAATSKSLLRYLETFAQTCAVMQTKDQLARVAAETAVDLADDGVVYAETRFAPEQHLEAGLSLDETVSAVLEGLRAGERESGGRIRMGLLLCAMRHTSRSVEIAELTLRHRDDGVSGYDIAGAEVGFPPIAHLEAFELLANAGMPVTIHAGEWLGPRPLAQAVHRCGAWRIGHGVSIAAEIDGDHLSPLATYVRDRRIPLEICPTSNVHTGGAASYEDHPIGRLDQLGFAVTVSSDNRLMSDTSTSQELKHVADAFDYGTDDIARLTLNAVDATFLPYLERERLWADVAKAYVSH